MLFREWELITEIKSVIEQEFMALMEATDDGTNEITEQDIEDAVRLVSDLRSQPDPDDVEANEAVQNLVRLIRWHGLAVHDEPLPPQSPSPEVLRATNDDVKNALSTYLLRTTKVFNRGDKATQDDDAALADGVTATWEKLAMPNSKGKWANLEDIIKNVVSYSSTAAKFARGKAYRAANKHVVSGDVEMLQKGGKGSSEDDASVAASHAGDEGPALRGAASSGAGLAAGDDDTREISGAMNVFRQGLRNLAANARPEIVTGTVITKGQLAALMMKIKMNAIDGITPDTSLDLKETSSTTYPVMGKIATSLLQKHLPSGARTISTQTARDYYEIARDYMEQWMSNPSMRPANVPTPNGTEPVDLRKYDIRNLPTAEGGLKSARLVGQKKDASVKAKSQTEDKINWREALRQEFPSIKEVLPEGENGQFAVLSTCSSTQKVRSEKGELLEVLPNRAILLKTLRSAQEYLEKWNEFGCGANFCKRDHRLEKLSPPKAKFKRSEPAEV